MISQMNDPQKFTSGSNERERKRGFLRLPQVLEILPISKSTWWKGIKEGRFPRPVKLTERTSAWLREDIESLCDQLVSSGIKAASSERGS